MSGIYVAQSWIFYPRCMAAQNTHNGNWVQFVQNKDGVWIGYGVNIIEHHFKALGEWFGKWIQGKVT